MIAVPLIVADTVFASATVDASVPLVTPLPFVTAGWPSVFPVPDEASTTDAPLIRLLKASRAVTVTVLAGPPASIELGDAVTVEVVAETGPGFTTTVGCAVSTVAPPTVTTTVFDSAIVDVKEPVITPEAFVVPAGCVTAFPAPLTVNVAASPGIGFPFASRAVIVTVLVPPPAVIGPDAVTSEFPAESGPGSTTTTGCAVICVLPIVTTTVLLWATVEVNDPVMTPEAFVVPTGCVGVFPVPLTVKLAVRPGIRLLNASRAMIVTVLVPLPAVIGVVAVADEVAAETAPGFTVTAAVCVITVPLIVAETVFAPAPVEVRVAVATPLPLVSSVVSVRVFPVPVAASTTVAPLIRLLFASRAVTVTVLPAPPAVIGLGAVIVEVLAETGPGTTVTTAVCVTAVPLMVAETVLAAATVEASVPVATPPPSVAPAGCVSVFPVPVAARTTVAPLIRLLNASRAVTVIVLVGPPAAIDAGATATVDCAAETAAGTTVTVVVGVMSTPPIVAETVFVSATVDAIVPVVTPLPFVAAGCTNVFPPPVEESTTAAPLIRLLKASRAVTVIVLVGAPAVMDVGEALIVEFAAEGAAGFTVTLGVVLSTVPPTVTVTVFACATVDVNDPVITPDAFVVPTGCEGVFPVPLSAKLAVRPGIGLLNASRAVMVIVLAAPPAVIGVDAVTVDADAETAPGFTTTVGCALRIVGPSIVTTTVLDPAPVEVNDPVITPAAFVVPAGCVITFPVPLTVKVAVRPGIGLLLASRTVIVTVLAPPPAVIGPEAVTRDCAAEGAPGVTVSAAVCVIATPLIVAEIVFASATVDATVPVVTPPAFVTAG